MIIKSKKDTYANFVYENKNLEEGSSYKYLGIIFITSSTRTTTLRKGLMEGGKIILVLKIIVKQQTL